MAYSHAETADLRCPTCGRDFSAPIWLLLDTAHAPDLLTHVREGTLHHTPCPHCQHILELDAPLLLYRPEQTPPLIFSPAQSTSQEQDQEQAAGLLGLLRHQIGDAWQESWLEQAQTIPRPLLPAALSDAPEAALRQFTAQMEQALAELAQQHPELMRELEAAAAQPPPDNPRLTLLQQFIATDTWTASYRFAQEHPELLDQETDTLLAALTQAAQDQGDNDAYGLFNQHLLLLRRAREIGLTAAFAEKIDRTPEELENASQIEQFRAAARDLLAELGVSEGEQVDPEQVARLLAERPDLLARLPVPLADASPGGQLTQQVFDFLFADDDEARQQLQAEAALLTVDAGQMIDQFIAAAHQSGDAAQVAQWQERRQLWQAAYHARLPQPLRPAPAIAEPVQPESWRERPEPQAVQAERATQYTVINPSNSAIGDNARVLNIHNIGDLALRWRRPNQGDPQRAKTALGRETELAELRQRLLAQQNAALVSRGTSAALCGQPAIGKTTLAAMYVARYGPDYSGGVFWLKVGPDNRTAASVRPLLQEMATFAYENNLAAQALLDNTTFAPETVRTLIQGHGPLLVVIDDVWGIEALREIQTALPDDSTILLTTRDDDVAYALENSPAAIQAVDVLSEADAHLFLTQKLPHLPEQLADQIAAGLGRHVLALTLAAAALTRHGEAQYDKTAQKLLRRVAAGQGFGDLPRLDKAERLTEVEIALKYSYDYLGEGREGGAWQSRFRALGSLAQEADFDTDAAAALWNTSIEAAGQFLLLLQGLSLIEEATSSRWQQHAILRAYALSLQTAEERLDFPERGADHYLTLVQHCYESIPRDHDRVEQEFSHIQHLFDWCEQHSPRRATRFTLWLSDFMRNRGRVPLLNQWLQTALHGAELHGDRLGKANTLTSLGDLERRLGNVEQARRHYDAALPLYEAEQARLGKANTLTSLGDLESRLGNVEQARRHYDAALPLYEAEQARLGKANTLKSLGDLESRLGNVEQARRHYDAALPLYEAEQARLGKANTLKRLGDLESRLGNVEQARRHYDAALPLYEAEQARLGKANTLTSLGDLERRLGNVEQARRHYDAALPLYEAEQDPTGKMNTWISLARLAASIGKLNEAETYYRQTFALAEQINFLSHPVVQGWQQEYAQLFAPTPTPPIPPEIQTLADHLITWIQTPDWAQSQAYLEQYALSLLTAEAEAILALLQQGNPDNRALPQHAALLSRCRELGITAAYQELQAALAAAQAAAQDPAAQALAALLQVDSPEAMAQTLEQYPALLELPTLAHLSALAAGAHQANQLEITRQLLTFLLILLEQYNHVHTEQVEEEAHTHFIALLQAIVPLAEQVDPAFAHALNQLSGWALNSLGNHYAAQGNHVQAITTYTQAISHSPENAMLYRNRAGQYLELKQYGEADQDITQAAQLEPEAPRLAQLRQALAGNAD